MDWRILPLGRSDWLAGRFRSGYVEGVWGRVAYVFLLFVFFFVCVFFCFLFFFVFFLFRFRQRGRANGSIDRKTAKKKKRKYDGRRYRAEKTPRRVEL